MSGGLEISDEPASSGCKRVNPVAFRSPITAEIDRLGYESAAFLISLGIAQPPGLLAEKLTPVELRFGGQQFGNGDAQGTGQPIGEVDTWCDRAVLQSRNVGNRDIHLAGKLCLSHAAGSANLA
jgi:hypothetical protein